MPFYSSLELYSEKDARLQSRTITFFAAQISISIHIYGAAPAVRFGKAVSNLQVKKKAKKSWCAENPLSRILFLDVVFSEYEPFDSGYLLTYSNGKYSSSRCRISGRSGTSTDIPRMFALE